MTAALASALMFLADTCLGDARREWALAMQAEFAIARDARRPLAFAMGCLIAALRELPRHRQGRFALASHGFALMVLIPVAGFQLMCAVSAAFPQGGALHGAPAPGSAQAVFLARSYLAAVPLLLSLWLALCGAHFRLAWVLLEGDWPRVIRVGALILAMMLTLLVFTGVLFIDDPRALVQAAVLAVEVMAIAALARWHCRLSADPAFSLPAG